MKEKTEQKQKEALNKADVSGSDLFSRKGRFIVSRRLILEANENVLKEIFTNFFPIDIERYHNYNFWDSIEYFGVSPHFETVEEACVAPSYEIVLDIDENGIEKFNRFDKLDGHYR